MKRNKYILLLLFILIPFIQVNVFADNTQSSRPVINMEVDQNKCVEIALKENLNLKQSIQELNQSKARVKGAEASVYPWLSANSFLTTGTASNMFVSAPGVMPDAMNMIPRDGRSVQNLSMSFPLFTGGILQSKIKESREKEKVAAYSLDALKLEVAFRTKEAYFQVLLSESLVEVRESVAKAQEEHLKITETLLNAGKVPKYYLLRNQAELADAKQMLIEAKNNRNLALVNLKTIMGISLASDLKINEKLGYSLFGLSLEESLKSGLNKRPELLQANHEIEAAEAEIKAAEGTYLPQIYLSSRYDWRNPAEGDFDRGYSVGVVGSLPLFDAGSRKSALDEAKAEKEKMTAARDKMQQEVEREITDSWLSLNSALEKIKSAEAASAQAEEDLRIAWLRYSAGKGINVEVLDSIAAYTKARINYIASVYEYNIYNASLLRAMGKF
ncbi:MAG: TolC family protein [Firmicutes bacterium]|nr:TolC family protein [Bacillota bacterium]